MVQRSATLLIVEDNIFDRKLFLAEWPADGPLKCQLTFAGTLAEARVALSDGPVDAVFLDLNLPDSNGLQTCVDLLRASRDIPVVVLTGLDDEEVGVQAVAAGAQDYLVKGRFDGAALTRSLRFALERSERLRAEREQRLLRNDPLVAERLARLSPREREVFDLLIAGLSLKAISTKLDISNQTASKHRVRVLEKMEVNNDVELVRLALGENPETP